MLYRGGIIHRRHLGDGSSCKGINNKKYLGLNISSNIEIIFNKKYFLNNICKFK